MTRKEIINKICPECNRYSCNDRCCKDCDKQLNEWLDEYDKQIKADVIEEFANIVLTEMEYGVGGSIENFIIEYVEQLKEQKGE